MRLGINSERAKMQWSGGGWLSGDGEHSQVGERRFEINGRQEGGFDRGCGGRIWLEGSTTKKRDGDEEIMMWHAAKNGVRAIRGMRGSEADGDAQMRGGKRHGVGIRGVEVACEVVAS